jgi:hypothetical protein
LERVRGEAAGLPAQLLEAIAKEADGVAVSVRMKMKGEERPPRVLDGEDERAC